MMEDNNKPEKDVANKENDDNQVDSLQSQIPDDIEKAMNEEQLVTGHMYNYISALETDVMTEVNGALKSAEEDETNIESLTNMIKLDIERQCNEMKCNIDKTKTTMMENLAKERENKKRIISMKKTEISDMKSKIEQLLDDCKEHLTNGGPEMERFLNENCPSLFQFSIEYTPIPTRFVQGVIDVPALEKGIGILHLGTEHKHRPLKMALITYPESGLGKAEAELITKFPTSTIVQDVWTTTSGDAWVTDEDSHLIVKYSKDGSIQQQINTTIYNECFVVDDNGDFLICDYWNSCIMKVTPNGDVSTLITDLVSAPTGICLNQEGEIVICLKDHKWISIYSPDGKIKRREMSITEPRYDEDENEDEVFMDKDEVDDNCGIKRSIFQIDSPYRITQNSRGDYIVVNGQWRYELVCLDKAGKFKWKYIIQQQEDVYPYNICCTKTDELLIADVEYQRFHVLNKDGQFLHYIMYKELGLEDAWSMSIDSEGRLWTGQDNGIINIIDLHLN